MTPKDTKPGSRELHQNELREAAEAMIFSRPQLVPDDHMEFGAWQAWAEGALREHPDKLDSEQLACLHVASEAAISHRKTFDPWPQFTRAMRRLCPEMAPDAIVFEVDADGGGRSIDCPNTKLAAGRIADGQLISQAWSKRVAKTWLRDFCFADEIEQAKKEIPEEILREAEAAGWAVGHDPEDKMPGVVLVHASLERVWPTDDIPGALKYAGMPVPDENSSTMMEP